MPKNYQLQFEWHRNDAAARGIPFLFDYDEWYQTWFDSGHLHERGHKKGQYVMARFEDRGPYAPWNVKIVTCSENISEGQLGKPKPETQKQKMRKPKSPEYTAKLVEAIRRRTRNPELKAQRSDACRRGWVTRKRNKGGIT